MALPITVPYTFGNATTAIPLSNLDSDYATVYQAVNGIGNGSVALANVTITGGTVSNVSGVVPTPFTANGVVYASSTSALATGSALTFNGTNLSTTGSVISSSTGTSAGFQWGGSTVTSHLYDDGSGNVYIDIGAGSSNTNVPLIIRTKGTGAVAFNTGGSQTMTLDASGNLLIGTTIQSPNTTAQIMMQTGASTKPAFQYGSGDGNWFGRISSGTSSGTIANFLSMSGSWSVSGTTFSCTKDYNGSFPSAALCITNQYNGNNSATFRFLKKASGSTTTDGTVTQLMVLDDSGNLNISSLGTGLVYSSSGTLTSTNPSDERLKIDIKNLSWGLTDILALRPVSYKWKTNTINQGTQYGFIAQEVQAVMPELVREFETPDGTRYGLEKEGIYATMVKAIQELSTLITAQQSTIQSLTERITALEGART